MVPRFGGCAGAVTAVASESDDTVAQTSGKSGKRSRPNINLAKVVQEATLDEDGFTKHIITSAWRGTIIGRLRQTRTQSSRAA